MQWNTQFNDPLVKYVCTFKDAVCIVQSPFNNSSNTVFMHEHVLRWGVLYISLNVSSQSAATCLSKYFFNLNFEFEFWKYFWNIYIYLLRANWILSFFYPAIFPGEHTSHLTANRPIMAWNGDVVHFVRRQSTKRTFGHLYEATFWKSWHLGIVPISSWPAKICL